MKLKTILIFITAMLLLAAANPNGPFKGKLKSIHMAIWGDTLTYQYDKDGRVIARSNGKGYKTNYSYQGNTIIAKTSSDVITMFLNSRGLVDSLTDVDSGRTTTVTHQEGFPDEEMLSFGATRTIPYSGNYTLELDEIIGVTTHSVINFSKKFTYDDDGYIKEVKVYLSSGRQIVCTNVVENGNIVSYAVRYPVDTIHQFNSKKKENGYTNHETK